MASATQQLGMICYKSPVDDEDDDDDDDENCNESIEKCTQLLDDCKLNSDVASDNSFSCSDSDITLDNFDDNEVVLMGENVCTTDKIIARNNENIVWDNINNKNPSQYKNIQVYNSQNVHIGNITHIHGPVYINEFAPTLNQNIIINNNNNSFPRIFPIVPRRTWLAQPPLDPADVKYYTHPPKYVIINHSATEEAYTQTDNNLIVRLIQQFHVESRKWNDIAYNFLAGADGSLYEGRGWNVVGAHTLGYNSISIGICFIGCYSRILPPAGVLKKVQALIKYGVETGAIAEDYTLLGHCQCRSSENPGTKLFEEMKTWDRWDGVISVLNPSPFMTQ